MDISDYFAVGITIAVVFTMALSSSGFVDVFQKINQEIIVDYYFRSGVGCKCGSPLIVKGNVTNIGHRDLIVFFNINITMSLGTKEVPKFFEDYHRTGLIKPGEVIGFAILTDLPAAYEDVDEVEIEVNKCIQDVSGELIEV